jgi:uncharacterized membrane protein
MHMSQTSPIEQTTGNRLVFEESAEIPTPIGDVYRKWTDFSRYPAFMTNVKEVRPIGGDRYHWTARIFGSKQEWDAEVTEREPQRRVSWRSLTGPYNAGTVSMTELPNGKTDVRVRMEYTPPAGQMGQRLDQLTQTTKREVKEDLENFKRYVSGEQALLGEPQTAQGFGTVMASLAVPAITGVVVGTGAWFLEEDLIKSRTSAKNLRFNRTINKAVHPVSREAELAGWFWTALMGGSIFASATLRAMGRKNDSLFVGQWAPTLLQTALLSRMIGRRELPHPVANAASYAFAGASLGSIITSVITHGRGSRSDGLFIGQWAPTFLGLSLLMRLLNR